MILFDIKNLEKGLLSGAVNDKDVFNYLLVSTVLTASVAYLKVDTYNNIWLNVIEVAISIILTIVTLIVTFTINKDGDNKDYFRRYISLSFVVGVRLFVYGLLAAIPIGIAIYFLTKAIGEESNNSEIFKVLIMAGVFIVYYFMLTNSFKRINDKNHNE